MLPLKKLLTSINPDLKIILDDQVSISVTTTIVIPPSFSHLIPQLQSDNFQQGYSSFLENFFNQLSFSDVNDESKDFMKDEVLMKIKCDPKEEVSDECSDHDMENFDHGDIDEDTVEANEEQDHDMNEDKVAKSEEQPSVINIKKEVNKTNTNSNDENKPKRARKPIPRINCPTCGKEIRLDTYERDHKLKCTGPKGPTERMCQMCGKLCKDKWAYQKHFESVHAEKAFCCELCDFKAGGESILKTHMRTTHGDKNRFMCEHCNFTTNRKKSLINHAKTHFEREYLPCSICGKGVLNMNTHMRTHRTEMTNCDLCGKEVRLSKLSAHKQRVHGERKFQCNLCNFATTGGYNLKVHISKVHFKQELEREQCLYCDVQTINLAHHVKIYHPEK